jgi:hypothetical protein
MCNKSVSTPHPNYSNATFVVLMHALVVHVMVMVPFWISGARHNVPGPEPRSTPILRQICGDTISYQRQAAKTDALDAWGTRWLNEDRRSQAYTALPTPPTGKISPVIQGSRGSERAVFSTLIRFITGHAFVGSYTARFRPDLPTGCPCGAPLQTIEHVVSLYPLYANARRDILQPIDPDASLPVILNSTQGGTALCHFIHTTRACMLPRRTWDPG